MLSAVVKLLAAFVCLTCRPFCQQHADYPHPSTQTRPHLHEEQPAKVEFAKRFPSEEAKRQHRLGVQMNLCVTDFRADNAGTQYVVGSDKDPLAPHDELNAVPTEAGVGVFKDVARRHMSDVMT